MAEKNLNEISLVALTADRQFHPSPQHWEDEVFYFLMLDRFSDGNENAATLFTPAARGNAIQTDADAARWRDAGTRFVGGNLRGLESKLGYLQRMGVTAIWISPIFKQVEADQSYHGYGIQNFLDVDHHFGTREDLQRLVKSAHALGIRVVLDIILNHSGDVFRYQAGDPAWNGQTFAVRGYRDAHGDPTLPFSVVDLQANPNAFPDGAVWPSDFQKPETFTCEGHISNFDFFPEFADGDFFGLKDIHHGQRDMVNGVDQIDSYSPASALLNLCEVYKFWIAFADVDGFRLDTVKHMDPGAVRLFASVIHEFTEAIGKDNFYIIGEITGGRDFAFSRLEVTGLDAALGVSDERIRMDGLVKGEIGPAEYFDLFRNSLLVQKDSHIWFRDKVVTSVDDHDHVDQGDHKHRFCAGGFENLILAAMALNATTLGIPCIYYGTEQLFDGEGSGNGGDRYIREAMFGGEFGAFRSRGFHFFNENQPLYREMAKIHKVRAQRLTLRRGRQFLRPISGNGVDFGIPVKLGGPMRSIVAWSRIFNEDEVLCAINTDPANALTAFVTIDDSLHAAGSRLKCLYSSDAVQIGQSVTVESRNGKSVSLTIAPGGFVIFAIQ